MTSPFFPIAVFEQPIESFSKWVKEGVNIVIEPVQTNNNTAAQRRAAAIAAGLRYIDVPLDANDCLAMVLDPGCYAICTPDEETLNAPWYSSNPSGFQTFLNAFLAKWTPILAPAVGKKTIWSNFPGGQIINARPWNTGGEIESFGALAGVISADQYPFENYSVEWDNWNAGKGLPADPLATNTTEQQYMIRVLKTFFPGKPLWTYIQTTDIEGLATARSPTGAEINAQISVLLNEGISGLAYFTHQFNGPGWSNPGAPAGGSNWDGRNPDVVEACISMNAKILGSLPAPASPSLDLTAILSRLSSLEASVASLKANTLSDVQLVVKRGV